MHDMLCSFCDEPIEVAAEGLFELHRSDDVRERYCRFACMRMAIEIERDFAKAMFTRDIPPYRYKCHA